MESKRGRKRKNEMYFGPEEEQAVVKFLETRHIQTLNLIGGEKYTITHNLGNSIIITGHYIKINENCYGNDNKIIEVDIDIAELNSTDKTIDIISEIDVKDAIIIVVNNIERDLVFNEWLKAPLDKMVEAIIRRYKLYRKGFTFEELHSDTVSFLMTKVHKFEVGRGKKAYSYFGTIAKNYILGLLIKDDKYLKSTDSYEDISESIEEREDLTYVIDGDNFSIEDFMKNLSDGIRNELNDDTLPSKKRVNENERKVGEALIEILENWETAFESMNGGSKYNKNSVLETMRNFTNLSTKDIRISMKRFKELYEVLKQYGL